MKMNLSLPPPPQGKKTQQCRLKEKKWLKTRLNLTPNTKPQVRGLNDDDPCNRKPSVGFFIPVQMESCTWDFLQKLQEPSSLESDFAILVLNQPILCDSELIKSLWNKALIRGLVDGGTNRWLDFINESKTSQLKSPDFISGDFDSIKPETKAYFVDQKVKMIFTPNQDKTDFTKALECVADFSKAEQLKIKMVLSVCENSGRFDQIISNISTIHFFKKIMPSTPVMIISSENITWVLSPGNHTIWVTKEFVKNQYSCGLLPFCGPTLVSTSGLKWNLDNQIMEVGGLISTSNTFTDTEIHVLCNRDLVWTTQYKV